MPQSSKRHLSLQLSVAAQAGQHTQAQANLPLSAVLLSMHVAPVQEIYLSDWVQSYCHSFAEDVYYCSLEYGPQDAHTSLGYYNIAKVLQSTGDNTGRCTCVYTQTDRHHFLRPMTHSCASWRMCSHAVMHTSSSC